MMFVLYLASSKQEIIIGAGHTSAVDWWALGNFILSTSFYILNNI